MTEKRHSVPPLRKVKRDTKGPIIGDTKIKPTLGRSRLGDAISKRMRNKKTATQTGNESIKAKSKVAQDTVQQQAQSAMNQDSEHQSQAEQENATISGMDPSQIFQAENIYINQSPADSSRTVDSVNATADQQQHVRRYWIYKTQRSVSNVDTTSDSIKVEIYQHKEITNLGDVVFLLDTDYGPRMGNVPGLFAWGVVENIAEGPEPQDSFLVDIRYHVKFARPILISELAEDPNDEKYTSYYDPHAFNYLMTFDEADALNRYIMETGNHELDLNADDTYITAETKKIELTFDNLSPSTKHALAMAYAVKNIISSTEIHMEHLLYGVYAKPNGPTRHAFNDLGVDELRLLSGLAEKLSYRITPPTSAALLDVMPPFSRHARQAMENAALFAARDHSDTIRTRHVFDGIRSIKDCEVVKVIESLGITLVDAPRTATRLNLVNLQNNWLSDLCATEDHLGHGTLVTALATFLKNRATKFPLVIGIDAPWGAGKSSVMYLLEKELTIDTRRSKANEEKNTVNKDVALSWGGLLNLCRQWPKKSFNLGSNNDNATAQKTERKFQTVYFNAWRHGTGTKLTASLVNNILNTIADKLSPIEREKFWLHINLKRLDIAALRRKAFLKMMSSSMVGFAFILAFVATLALFFFKPAYGAYYFLPGTGFLGYLGVIFPMLRNKAVSFDFQKYLKAPDYNKLMGPQSEIERDFKETISYLKEMNVSLAVFVDDLDRCSPPDVAAVVESINVFFGQETDDCVFILGMHRELVATSLELAYKDLIEKMNGKPELAEELPFGQRFLEKIVQFVVRLPEPSDANVEKYISHLTKGKSTAPSSQRQTADADIPVNQAAGDKQGKNESQQDHTISAGMQTQAQPDNMEQQSSSEVEKEAVIAEAIQTYLEQLRQVNDLLNNTDYYRKKIVTELVGKGISRQIAESTADSVINRVQTEKIANSYDDKSEEVIGVFNLVKDSLRRNPRQYVRFFNTLRFDYYLRAADINYIPEFSELLNMAKWAALSLEWPNLTSILFKNKQQVFKLLNEDLDKNLLQQKLVDMIEVLAGPEPTKELVQTCLEKTKALDLLTLNNNTIRTPQIYH